MHPGKEGRAVSRIVFRNANLLDGDNPSRPNTTVVVEGEIIAEVTPAAAPQRAGDQVVDLAGMTLMPGMVSGHYHAAYSMGGEHKIGMAAPPTQLALYALANTQKALRAGYTSLVGAGTFPCPPPGFSSAAIPIQASDMGGV